jgi:DNA-binding CsgD family transcriptional regulator
VERHRSRVFEKVGVRSRAGLVRVMREDDRRGTGPD